MLEQHYKALKGKRWLKSERNLSTELVMMLASKLQDDYAQLPNGSEIVEWCLKSGNPVVRAWFLRLNGPVYNDEQWGRALKDKAEEVRAVAIELAPHLEQHQIDSGFNDKSGWVRRVLLQRQTVSFSNEQWERITTEIASDVHFSLREAYGSRTDIPKYCIEKLIEKAEEPLCVPWPDIATFITLDREQTQKLWQKYWNDTESCKSHDQICKGLLVNKNVHLPKENIRHLIDLFKKSQTPRERNRLADFVAYALTNYIPTKEEFQIVEQVLGVASTDAYALLESTLAECKEMWQAHHEREILISDFCTQPGKIRKVL